LAFEIKQNDLRPLFVVSLADNIGEPDEEVVNLTTAGTVVFNMRSSGGAVKVSRGTCSITDAANGEVTYAWGTADTNTAGAYEAEVEVLWNDAKPETFPGGPSGGDEGTTNTSYWAITITDDVA
jgi:hypothetical protein